VNGSAFAPAKINLFLHVGPVADDGYHPLCSWMTFADVGDRVHLGDGGEPLVVDGPFAAELAGTPADDNLVLRATRALLARTGAADLALPLRLSKTLPVASGLGGGSSDAGAALRLVREALALTVDDDMLEAVARDLGADGAACLWARPAIAEGRGERLSAPPTAPMLNAVLANPGVACPTGPVYRAFDAAVAAGARCGADRPALPERFETAAEVAEALANCRNDLEAPAVGLAPEVGRALALLRSAPEALLARLSGSGATCFALCADEKAAERLAGEVAAAEPSWWVKTCRLGAPVL
jgi:4-diphosphocytidyl-2-C-methyl-D-erythritol kinase